MGTYDRRACAVFRKTKALWGDYSNMVAGFAVRVNGVRIQTTEALYQACRFPHLPEVQREIIAQASPMVAKMKSKTHRKNSRPEFDAQRPAIMWWTLRIKLACNPHSFGRKLLASKQQAIVEDSAKDDYWGAVPTAESTGTLVGRNVLGKLLVALRDRVREFGVERLLHVEPPCLPDFLLYGEPIRAVEGEL